MNTLYLHLGSEKTGSSYLQHLCVKHRDLLGRRGIVFPRGTPHDERCMHGGQISAGNGRLLAAAVDNGDWSAVRRLIDQALARLSSGNERVLLISSEHLLTALAREERLAGLKDTLAAAGISVLSLLLVLRDPAEQLLSLYKHRAKSGTAGRIHDWVNEGYGLPHDLQSLRRQVKDCAADLTVRSYQRHTGALEGLFFTDWLGMENRPDAEQTEVNPSLSLSELELIHRMADKKPALVPFLYQQLAAVPGRDKVLSNALDAHARAVAETICWHHREEWQCWNALLPEGDCLTIPDKPASLPDYPQTLEFSSTQLDALAVFMAESTRLRFLFRLFWKSRLRPGLARVKRFLANSKPKQLPN